MVCILYSHDSFIKLIKLGRLSILPAWPVSQSSGWGSELLRCHCWRVSKWCSC
jgi:hypothetical protein